MFTACSVGNGPCDGPNTRTGVLPRARACVRACFFFYRDLDNETALDRFRLLRHKKNAIELAHFINDTDPFMQRSLLLKRGMDYLLRPNKDMQKDLRRNTSTIFPFFKKKSK